jgi:hypothetical protein
LNAEPALPALLPLMQKLRPLLRWGR